MLLLLAMYGVVVVVVIGGQMCVANVEVAMYGVVVVVAGCMV